MQITKNIRLVAAMSLLTASMNGSAAIIDHGDYLTDTATGLDWLDVTKTVNMSFNTVTGMLGTGGTYDGWRYATGDEFNTLVSNYTGIAITPGYYGKVIQEPDRIDNLVTMLGSTLDAYYLTDYGQTWDAYYGYPEGAGRDYTLGVLADPLIDSINGYYGQFGAHLGDYDERAIDDYSWAHATYYDANDTIEMVGSFLVRPSITVPEPGSIGLLGLGLVGLAATRRRRSQE